MIFCWILLLLSASGLSLGDDSCSDVVAYSSIWESGASGKLTVTFPSTVSAWKIEITFTAAVTDFQIWVGVNIQCSGTKCTFENMSWNGNQNAGSTLGIDFLYYSNGYDEISGVSIDGTNVCTTSGGGDTTSAATTEAPVTTEVPVTTTESPGTTTESPGTTTTASSGTTTSNDGSCVSDTYGFAEALDFSLLFYEAQRSGDLPEDEMRITWRKDSALDDAADDGTDLAGGYYDAGDYVKFNFPQAASLTLLSWGGISYKDGYVKAGMLDYLLDAVKWGTDYLIKCHVSANEFYGQVGNGGVDHSYWGRPEDMTMDRPAYKIDTDNPGSELAAEVAATFASASLLFADSDPDYSAELLTHAIEMYDFADNYRGKYDASISDAAGFYPSAAYEDELIWGALWLYKATGDDSYLTKAQSYYDDSGRSTWTQWAFSWDEKTPGIKVLLAEETGSSDDLNALRSQCQSFIDIETSPLGRSHRDKWASLRYSSNFAFICLQASDILGEESFKDYALDQINYALGSSGRSFVVGFGTNPPTCPHHRSSSCPDSPDVCDDSNQYMEGPNTHTLYGALVGGPDSVGSDDITDDRTDYITMEVALDYNAGFQSTLAGLLSKSC